MRGRAHIILAAYLLTACQSVSEALKGHVPNTSEWRLVEMKGLEEIYNSDLRATDKPLSGPDRLRQLILKTQKHSDQPYLDILSFTGCNEVTPLLPLDREPDGQVLWWGAGQLDNWCGQWVQAGGIANKTMLDMHHRVFKVYYTAEKQFVELIDKVESQEIDHAANTLDLLDVNGVSLMKFKQRESPQ